MSDTYLFLARFAQNWGMLYSVMICIGAFAWALWPSRKADFERAARIPLGED